MLSRIALILATATLCLAGSALASSLHPSLSEAPAVADCFPAHSWDANVEDRPCTTVARPQEDGSGDLILGSVGADAAACVIPNVYEERGTFYITCRRVPNR